MVDKRWTDIDWDASAPTDAELDRSRSRMKFVHVEQVTPALMRLQSEFCSAMWNGGALTATFDVHDADDAAHFMLARNHSGTFEFVRLLLTSTALVQALPELKPVDPTSLRWLPFPRPQPDPSYSETASLMLDGELASALAAGGAYGSFKGSAAQAKHLATAASTELMNERYEEFRVDTSHTGWSRWFRNWIWDTTWIVTDLRHHRTTVFCITDTD